MGVPRTLISNRRLELTKFKVPNVSFGIKDGELKKQIDQFELRVKFNQTGRGKKILRQQRRNDLNDFERFKVMVLKRKLARASRTQVNKLKKSRTN